MLAAILDAEGELTVSVAARNRAGEILHDYTLESEYDPFEECFLVRMVPRRSSGLGGQR